MRAIKSLPLPAKRVIRKLGSDIHDARRRRRIPMQLMAERAAISRTTLSKIENGDPSVALGFYLKVLFVLGLIDRVSELADARFDEIGLMLEDEKLPRRIHLQQDEVSNE